MAASRRVLPAFLLLAFAGQAVAEEGANKGLILMDYPVATALEKLGQAYPEVDPQAWLSKYLLAAGAPLEAIQARDEPNGVWRLRMTARQHTAFANLLEGIEVGGVRQVVITCQMIELPNIEALGDLDWDSAVRFPSQEPLPPVGASHEAETPGGVRVESARYAPYLFAAIDSKTTSSVVKRVKSSPRCNVVSAPKVTCFNGQHATVSSTTQSPYVTGVTAIKGPYGKAYQPEIAVFDCGCEAEFRPLADEGRVRLSARLTQTVLEDVAEVKLPGRDAPTVQAPKLAKRSIEWNEYVEPGASLLVAPTLAAEHNGKLVCWLVSAETIDPAEIR